MCNGCGGDICNDCPMELEPKNELREHIKVVFDTAVGSLDFGSGFLDDDEVKSLRWVAKWLGVEPIRATPANFVEKYYTEVRGSVTWSKPADKGDWRAQSEGMLREKYPLAEALKVWLRIDCVDFHAYVPKPLDEGEVKHLV
jgi:hypothetical protein